jgi:hypothetical protein
MMGLLYALSAVRHLDFDRKNFFILVLIILQNYTTVSKFSSFDNQPPCATAVTVGHGGWANSRGPSRV